MLLPVLKARLIAPSNTSIQTCVGITSVAGCKACVKGRYSESGVGQTSSTTCQPCARGKFSEEIGGTSSAVCLPCSADTSNPHQGRGEPCETCPTGRLTAGSRAQESCSTCSLGKFLVVVPGRCWASNGESCPFIDRCDQCPQGKKGLISAFTSSQDDYFVSCPAGS